MAKFDSIIKFTGNLDGMVGMKGANGQTYIRKNVKPADPKTTAQVETRTKVSLAGQISKLTPKAAIIGMGGSTRERRNSFMKNILRKATIETSDGTSEAFLTPENLVFSVGRDFPVNITVVSATGVARGVRVTITDSERERLDGAGVSAVMLVFVWADNDNYYRFIDVKTTNTSALVGGVTSLNLNAKCNVYVIPLLPADGASRVAYEEGVSRISSAGENENGYNALAQLSSNGTIALGQSRFSGVGTVEGDGN